MKVYRGRKYPEPHGASFDRDEIRFTEHEGDEVRITSGPDFYGVEVLVVQMEHEPAIVLDKRNVRALLPHFHAWVDTSSLRVVATEPKGA